jgi:hypothetical protein
MPVFFMANTSLSEDIAVQAEFQVDKSLLPWVWNPETGERLRFPTAGSNRRIDFVLPRATSLLRVFESRSNGELHKAMEAAPGGKEITGPWKLDLQHMHGPRQQMELDTLTDLIDLPETEDFAGTVLYEKRFHVDSAEGGYLDLGDVQGISELMLNGKALGTRWYGAHVYDLGDALKPGENMLTIKLTTICGNYVKSLQDNPVAQRWTGGQDKTPMGVLGPVSLIQAAALPV